MAFSRQAAGSPSLWFYLLKQNFKTLYVGSSVNYHRVRFGEEPPTSRNKTVLPLRSPSGPHSPAPPFSSGAGGGGGSQIRLSRSAAAKEPGAPPPVLRGRGWLCSAGALNAGVGVAGTVHAERSAATRVSPPPRTGPGHPQSRPSGQTAMPSGTGPRAGPRGRERARVAVGPGGALRALLPFRGSECCHAVFTGGCAHFQSHRQAPPAPTGGSWAAHVLANTRGCGPSALRLWNALEHEGRLLPGPSHSEV